jgi:hypothetical protein
MTQPDDLLALDAKGVGEFVGGQVDRHREFLLAAWAHNENDPSAGADGSFEVKRADVVVRGINAPTRPRHP